MASSIGAIAAIAAVIEFAGEAIQLGSRQKKFSGNIQGILVELELLTQVLQSVEDRETADPGSLPNIEHSVQACQSDIEKLRQKLRDSESSRSFMVRLKWSEKVCSRYVSVLERHRAGFSHALRDLQLSRSRIMEAQMETLGLEKERDDRAWAAAQRTRLLDWLYLKAFDRTHVRIHSRRQKGTCYWILRTPEFIEWKNSSCKLLWGYGIPGAGKTFLSSMVIDSLLDSPMENYGVAYIYFRHEENDQQKPADVFSSFAKQLVCQVPHTPKEVEELHGRLGGQQKRPSPEDLCAIILSLSGSFARTFIICDALDECDQESRREIFPLFSQMCKAGINLFLTSREYPEDIQNFVHDLAIKIRLSATKEDITCYIEQEIIENPRADRLIRQALCKDKIISCLIDCARGMFLLVRFYLEYICQQTTSRHVVAELERIQNNSSQDRPLDPTYDKIMEILQLQPRNCVKLAFKILLWLVKAQRTLTVNEIRIAVSIEADQSELETMDLPDKTTLLDLCAGLVTIDESNDTIQLSHPTVQDYLLRNSIIPQDGDFQLAMCCITFLSFSTFAEGACNSDSSLRTRHDLYPFLDYAAKSLPFHLKGCNEESTTQLVLRFLSGSGNIDSYLQAVYASPKHHTQDSGVFDDGDGHHAYPRGQNSLHIAAALGHCSVARLLVEDMDIDAVDNNGRTAIHLASSEGHESVARLLLQKGADPFIADNDGITALNWAERKGPESLVRSMLQKRAESPGLPVDTSEDQTSAAQLPLKDNDVSAADNDGNLKAIRTNLSSKAGRYKLETTILENLVIHTVYKTDLAARQRKVPIEERWTLKKEIGIGGFGVVLLEEEKRGKLRAVKKLSLARRNVDYSQELNILAKLTDHPYLFVEFLGWYEDSQFLYIAMEYVEFGDLNQYIKDGSARLKAREIANQLHQGLMILHERQICHRDLKPQNVLVACVKPIWVKIADFGVSKREKNTNLHTQLGTGGYLAPEILGLLPKRFGTGRSYTNAVDFWALGCLVHEILTSKLPFAEEPFPIGCSEMSLFEELGEESIAPQVDMGLLLDYCQGTIEFPTGPLQGSQVSEEGIRFVKRLLDPDPSSRMPPAEGLKSPWLLEEEN